MIHPHLGKSFSFLVLLFVLVSCASEQNLSLESTALIYPPDSKLTKTIMPKVPRPLYLQPITDPVFGTRITRISAKDPFRATFPDGDFERFFNSSLKRLSHDYAKNQPWNADGSLIMLNLSYPAPILDGNTYQLLRWIHQPSRAVWSQLEPHKTYGTHPDMNVLVKADMRTDWTEQTLHTFSEYETIDFGLGEGNLSNDDRYIALFGFKNGKTDILVYDLQLDQVTARRSLGSAEVCNCNAPGSINNITMSQSGKYVVIEYNARGTGSSQGIWVLDPKNNLAPLRNVSRNGGSHFDVCYDLQKSDVIVTTNDNDGSLMMRRFDNGVKTVLLSDSKMGYPIHISCRNTKRPGWAYISSFDASYDAPDKAYYQTLFAVQLNPSASGDATVQPFAHEHHAVRSSWPPGVEEIYQREPMAVPNRTGDKVMWASDWGDGNVNAPIYAYVAQMPSQ